MKGEGETEVLGRGSLPLRLVVSYTFTFALVFGVLWPVLDRALAVSLVAALAAGLAVAFVAWRSVKSLTEMREVAAAMAAGNLDQRAPIDGSSEMRELAFSLNRMAEELSGRLGQAAEDRRTRELILAAMAEGVALVSDDDSIQYLNPAAERILAIPSRADGGIATPLVRSLVSKARKTVGAAEEQFEIGHPPRVVRASAIPVDSLGRMLLVVRDVTESARVEGIRKDFAAAASHELKTPVASIRAAAETLRDAVQTDPAASRRFADQLFRDSERLSRIVADLLDLSRLESERPRIEPIRLDSLAREEAERFDDAAQRRGIHLEIHADGPVELEGSGKDLALAIRNLLDNAVEYTRAGGTVTVEVMAGDGHGALVVRDSGVGIPAKDLPRIFERFYRVDRARSRSTGGTGLGLALVKHVAEEHGGTVEVSSELGRGSTFRLVLPLTSSPDPGD